MGEERGMRIGITTASEEPTVERLAELEGLILKMIAEQEAAWAYFVKYGAYVKIGYSRSSEGVRKRLRTYVTAAPERAWLIGVSYGGEQTEKSLHRVLQDYRFRGEWFRLKRRLLDRLCYEGLYPGRATEGWPFVPGRGMRRPKDEFPSPLITRPC